MGGFRKPPMTTFSPYLKHLNAQLDTVQKDAEVSEEILRLMDRLSPGSQTEAMVQARLTFKAQQGLYLWMRDEITRLIRLEAPTDFIPMVDTLTSRVADCLGGKRVSLHVRLVAMVNRTVAFPSGKTETGDYYGASMVIPDPRWIGEVQDFLLIHLPGEGVVVSHGDSLSTVVQTVDEAFAYINVVMGGELTAPDV
ncbi:MAG: hypothetical protein BWY82_02063 [Verrucomicrobia bacterium ADurb.Bin474]|nr:MAG: hypothetical protein BWY82_02063 [Verrucomicrobia bacterium ADurb.Bin474]